MSEARLPASVQPQVWVNDRAMDVGAEVAFDAHAAMAALPAAVFRRVAQQVFGHGHDYDELALESGVVSEWLSGGRDNTFCVLVDESDFEEWLESVGLDRQAALVIDDDGMKALQARTEAAPKLPAV